MQNCGITLNYKTACAKLTKLTGYTALDNSITVQLFTENKDYPLGKSLIIHDENTKEIMSVKEFVYLVQNHADI